MPDHQWYPSRRELARGSGRHIEGSGLKEVVVYHFLHYILHLYIDIRYIEGSGKLLYMDISLD